MSEESKLVEKIPEGWISPEESISIVLLDGSTDTTHTIASNVVLKNPYELDLNQFIPNLPVKYEGFLELVSKVVSDAQAREGVVASERVKVAREYHPDHFPSLGDEVISYKLLHRAPANMSHDGKSRPNRGFSFDYEYRSPKEPNKVLCVESRPIDHIVEISVWAKTATLADKRALWLERLLVGHRWVFTSHGVNPFQWRERGPDTLWTPSSTRLHQRPIKFFARLKEYTVLAYPTIREISIVNNIYGGQ